MYQVYSGRYAGRKQEVTKVVSLVKMAENVPSLFRKDLVCRKKTGSHKSCLSCKNGRKCTKSIQEGLGMQEGNRKLQKLSLV